MRIGSVAAILNYLLEWHTVMLVGIVPFGGGDHLLVFGLERGEGAGWDGFDVVEQLRNLVDRVALERVRVDVVSVVALGVGGLAVWNLIEAVVVLLVGRRVLLAVKVVIEAD